MGPIQKLIKARAGLVLDQPFFGSLALRLKIVEDNSCKTGWTDGESLGFNPAFVEGLTLDQTKGFMAHEILHLCCEHQTRRGSREAGRWNKAGDYAINPILEEAKMVLPPGRLLNPSFAGKYAEEIYNLLSPEPEEGGKGDGDGEGEGGSNSSDPGQCGEVRDPKGSDGQKPSRADLDRSAAEWKVAAAQAAQQAKAMGNLPDGVNRLVGEILEPHVDWREVLWQFVDQMARNDYSWSVPSRRYAHLGLFLPSLKSEELKPIVLGIDSSLSIDVEMLNQFSAELTAILQAYQTSCTVIYCDAAVQNVEVFGSEDLPVEIHPKGGGGTDFRPPFTWVEKNGLAPSCFVYLTDMECSRFPEPPDYPVLWVRIGKGGVQPPFGELVEMRQ
jgi:predicted metal-dependent peptidase